MTPSLNGSFWCCIEFVLITEPRSNLNQNSDQVLISFWFHFEIKMEAKKDQIFVHVLILDLMLFWYQNGYNSRWIIHIKLWWVKDIITGSIYFWKFIKFWFCYCIDNNNHWNLFSSWFGYKTKFDAVLICLRLLDLLMYWIKPLTN